MPTIDSTPASTTTSPAANSATCFGTFVDSTVSRSAAPDWPPTSKITYTPYNTSSPTPIWGVIRASSRPSVPRTPSAITPKRARTATT